MARPEPRLGKGESAVVCMSLWANSKNDRKIILPLNGREGPQPPGCQEQPLLEDGAVGVERLTLKEKKASSPPDATSEKLLPEDGAVGVVVAAAVDQEAQVGLGLLQRLKRRHAVEEKA